MTDWLRAQRLQRDRDRLQARVTELERENRDARHLIACAVRIGGANGKLTIARSTLLEDYDLSRIDDPEGHVILVASPALAADRTEEGEANEPA